MYYKFVSYVESILLIAFMAATGYGCKEDAPSDNGEDAGLYTGDLKITLPAFIDVVIGQPCTLQQEKGVTAGNIVLLVKDGNTLECKVTAADADSFTFNLPDSFEAGEYKFYLKRGTIKTFVGTVQFNIVDEAIPLKPGATVYGKIKDSDGNPVAGVVVSDGIITSTTDGNGLYYLESDKSQRVVFYSVPSGYEPETSGVFPTIYQKLVLDKSTPECHSFSIKKITGNQDNFKVLFFGDIHLSNRHYDLEQFKNFTKDVKNYRNSHPAEHIYAVTLGDMSHDKYWEEFNYALPQYVNTVNNELDGLTIYHTIGNHDHDMKSIADNLAAVSPFSENVAPAWYSFNIGRIHFVVMDNTDCSAYDGKSANYTQGLYGVQNRWLENDLKHVAPEIPVYILTHIPFFSDSNLPDSYSLRNYGYDKTLKLLAGRELHFVNAHLHQQYTMLPKDTPAKNYSHPVYQHNIAAVCADWWYTGLYNRDCLVCQDGTPAGYSIFDFSGTDASWLYKGTQRDENEQFHVYDMNNVDFSYALKEFKNLTNKNVIAEFTDRYVTPYSGDKFKNMVLINVWGWNSECKLEVKTKSGQILATGRYNACDPFSILALIPHWDASARTSIPPSYTKNSRYHFFLASCPDATSDIIVTFTDRSGRVFSKEIQRPYAFNLNQYKTGE